MQKLWTPAEVARYLGINEAQVEQLVREGKLTGYKLGGQLLRFLPDQVKELKTAMEPHPQGAHTTLSHASSWQERVRDFFYFYDFYLLSFLLLAGLVLYLVISG